MEIIYGHSDRLRFDTDQATKAVAETISDIGWILAADVFDRTDENDFTTSTLMLWREEQRAIGELMRPDGEEPSLNAARRTAIGSIVIGVITVGVDLAAEPKGTAVASIDWSGWRAVVRDLVVGADDALVLSTVASADKVGIDCPFGWPVPFVEFVSGHRAGHVAIPPGGSGRDWRRTLAYRATDEAVHQLIGLHPLSVAADRIGHTAMRCAALLAQLEQLGQPVDRRGFGAWSRYTRRRR